MAQTQKCRLKHQAVDSISTGSAALKAHAAAAARRQQCHPRSWSMLLLASCRAVQDPQTRCTASHQAAPRCGEAVPQGTSACSPVAVHARAAWHHCWLPPGHPAAPVAARLRTSSTCGTTSACCADDPTSPPCTGAHRHSHSTHLQTSASGPSRPARAPVVGLF